MLKILQARLQKYKNYELPDVQAGFRKGRGTREQIVGKTAVNCAPTQVMVVERTVWETQGGEAEAQARQTGGEFIASKHHTAQGVMVLTTDRLSLRHSLV